MELSLQKKTTCVSQKEFGTSSHGGVMQSEEKYFLLNCEDCRFHSAHWRVAKPDTRSMHFSGFDLIGHRKSGI